MKKNFVLILALALLLCFSACGIINSGKAEAEKEDPIECEFIYDEGVGQVIQKYI